MARTSIEKMKFSLVYPLYIQKAEKKDRTKDEVNEIISWLTGYDEEGIKKCIDEDIDLETFFKNAPCINENASKITGSICGIKVQEIEEDLVRNIRYLDKLVDELAKDKPMEKILRK